MPLSINGVWETVKTAFTLAEVLITLGIIGIVAALTIPTLVTNIQKKQTVTKLQKAISVINQAYRMSYSEVGEATAEEAQSMGATAYFEKYWAPYIKTAHICKTYSDCGYNSSFPFYKRNGGSMNLSLIGFRTTFYTSDGFLYIIFVAQSGTTGAVENTSIFVDLNGGKGPNKLGYDVFTFQRNVDSVKGGYVTPTGQQSGTEYVNQNCISGNGYLCTEKIRRDGWQIKDDYGWGK